MNLELGFGAKILLALVGTVVLLTGTSLWVVGHQTRTQVEEVVERTADRAETVLSEVEELRFELFEPLVAQFAFAPRALSLLAYSLDEDDFEQFAGELLYEMELREWDRGLLVVTDMAGRPLVTYMDRELVHEPGRGARERAAPTREAGPGDPQVAEPLDPLVREILEEGEAFAMGYLLFQDHPYSAQTYYLDFFGRPLGTLTLGLPMDDRLARRLGDVVGAEVCFVVEGRCVAGTPAPDDEFRAKLASAAGETAGRGGSGQGGITPPESGDGDGRGRAAGAGGPSDTVLTEWNDRRWALVAAPLPGGEEAGIVQVLGVPLDPVLAPFDRIRAVQRWAGIGALALAALLGFFLARGLVRPVRTLVAATDRVREGDYDFHVDVPSRDEMGHLADAFNEMLGDLALKERYRGVLDKVVSRDVADEMLRGEIRLGGETREVTTLFADVRGFTSLSEGMASQEIITMLNEWFDRATRVVESAGGVVDKFLGDGFMAIFGAPIHQPDHAARAVRAAIGIRDGLTELNREREVRGEGPIQVGFGIATGPVVAGNAGSQNRLNYTVLGPSVNLAARLCGEAGAGQILISCETREAVSAVGVELDAEEEGEVRLKGVSDPVRPWRVRTLGAVAGALLGVLGWAGHAQAQWFPFDPPTLAEAGVEYITPGGFFQLTPSGQLDVEGFFPGDAAPWLIPETDAFASARLRLFLDAFFGDRVFASVEGRVDRGDEPTADDFEARLQQAFVRVRVWDAGALHLQAGQFTTPFGNHPSRRRTEADPFIRPPLQYEHPTVLRTHQVPESVDDLLGWKDGDNPRALGVPGIWGTPYPTGVMVMGAFRDLDFQVALVNSAPSAEPDLWDPDAPFGGTQVLRVGYQLSPALHVGASYAAGPWIREGVDDPFPDAEDPVPEDRFRTYKQKIMGIETTFTQGMVEVRAEAMMNRWGLPEIAETPEDLSWYLEGKLRSGTGLYGAARVGQIHFGDMTGSGGSEAWDYDIRRFQFAAGYRLARNLELRGEFLMNRSPDESRLDTELTSVQLWWRF